jgi:hypothetical protein
VAPRTAGSQSRNRLQPPLPDEAIPAPLIAAGSAGILSDSYRRIDSRPVFEAFATGVQEKGALPYEGYVTDTKIAIQAIMPEVYEPVPER